MQIKIIAVGKLKEKYLKEAVNEYLKRLSAYCKIEIVEIPEEKISDNPSKAEEDNVRQKEGQRIINAISERNYVISLDIKGKQLSSEELAEKIQDLALYGNSSIAIIIGGSIGLSQEVLERSDFRLSFSKMTFPHQLMRIILLEQIYRAFKINAGETYHK
ncbi:MAG TPA: 23S rRNA (pseudouridine(1915)-N(3))-methyltransferase RlmH [Clostridiaceae bacterium]|nr:23S rRNA (pseudouridine(1915)-N(3))-methyltransferase RlmH [Clostridiaceae bacterium]